MQYAITQNSASTSVPYPEPYDARSTGQQTKEPATELCNRVFIRI